MALRKKALAAAGNENTLNRWAGYTPTPEEAAALIETAKEKGLQLLQPVGQDKAISAGNALIYDLGGNVSEYAADGTPIGFSAYDHPDAMAKSKWKSNTSGFRVIKE
jgi:hypothetical protein